MVLQWHDIDIVIVLPAGWHVLLLSLFPLLLLLQYLWLHNYFHYYCYYNNCKGITIITVLLLLPLFLFQLQYIYTCVYIYILIIVYVCIYTYVYVCVYIYIYIYICIYTYIHTDVHAFNHTSISCSWHNSGHNDKRNATNNTPLLIATISLSPRRAVRRGGMYRSRRKLSAVLDQWGPGRVSVKTPSVPTPSGSRRCVL